MSRLGLKRGAPTGGCRLGWKVQQRRQPLAALPPSQKNRFFSSSGSASNSAASSVSPALNSASSFSSFSAPSQSSMSLPCSQPRSRQTHRRAAESAFRWVWFQTSHLAPLGEKLIRRAVCSRLRAPGHRVMFVFLRRPTSPARVQVSGVIPGEHTQPKQRRNARRRDETHIEKPAQ